MSIFWTLAIPLVLFAAALVPWPFGRGKAASSARPTQVALYEDECREVRGDDAAANQASARAAEVLAGLGQRLALGTGAAAPALAKPTVPWPKLAIAFALVASLAGSIYVLIGRKDVSMAKPGAVAVSAKAPARAMDLDKLALRLEQRLEREGGDADAWALLGRAQQRIGQYAKAIDSFTRAMATHPKDADLLADMADALLMANDRHWSPKASEAVRHALEINPAQPKALSLSASEQMARGDYQAALRGWNKLEAVAAADPALARQAADGIREANARLGGKNDGADKLAQAPAQSPGTLPAAGGMGPLAPGRSRANER